MRPNGLVLLLGLVLVGFAAGAGWYSWEQPRAAERVRRAVEAAPSGFEGRLEEWLRFGAPQVHHRLTVFGRASAEHPWLVTHAVAASAEEPDLPPEIHGLDVRELPRDLLRREGGTVVLELPPPRPLGRLRLEGDALGHVPLLPAPGAGPDPSARLEEVVRWLLEDLIAALERDVPGAAFEIRVGAG